MTDQIKVFTPEEAGKIMEELYDRWKKGGKMPAVMNQVLTGAMNMFADHIAQWWIEEHEAKYHKK